MKSGPEKYSTWFIKKISLKVALMMSFNIFLIGMGL